MEKHQNPNVAEATNHKDPKEILFEIENGL